MLNLSLLTHSPSAGFICLPMCLHKLVFIFTEKSSDPGDSITAADVVLFGLNTVIPLMSEDLLRVGFQN